MTATESLENQCKKMTESSRCKGDCCGCIPIPLLIFKKNKEKIQREIGEEVILQKSQEIYPITKDAQCCFLTSHFKCAIYDERPELCRQYGFIPQLQCPYVWPNGVLRNRTDRRKIDFQLKRNTNAFLKRVKGSVKK